MHVFVETHIDKQKHTLYTSTLLYAFGTPASNLEDSGIHAHGITDSEQFHIEGCGYHAFLWEVKARSILVAVIYCKTNEGIQGQTNSQILARPLALIEAEASTKQYIIVGDWNSPPGQLQATVLGSKFHWEINAPNGS